MTRGDEPSPPEQAAAHALPRWANFIQDNLFLSVRPVRSKLASARG
jgi:hypothetical protein